MSYFHNFVKFSKTTFTLLPNFFAHAPTNRRFAEKIGLVGTLHVTHCLEIWHTQITYQSQTAVKISCS